MPRAVRSSLLARLLAAVVALTLSGAPTLAARPEKTEHRCLCKAHARGDHDCECARCHEGTGKQAPAPSAVPPCHRTGVKDGEHAPARRVAGRPCITGTCGGPEDHLAPLTPLDAFTLPLALAPSGGLPPAGSVERPAASLREAPSAPETPPPRAAPAPARRA